MFGFFPLQNQVKQRFGLGLRTKSTNLVGRVAELAEEMFQQVGGTHAVLAEKAVRSLESTVMEVEPLVVDRAESGELVNAAIQSSGDHHCPIT